MKTNKYIILINAVTIIISVISLGYAIHCKNIINSINNESIMQDTINNEIFIEANKENPLYLSQLNKQPEIFFLSENNKKLILPNPKENSYYMKYEIYFEDFDFSINTNLISPGKSSEINLKDILKEGTYNIIVKSNFWCDEYTRLDSAICSFKTLLTIE